MGLLLLVAPAPAAELPAGVPIERVAAASDPGQAYALYLPERLDRARPAPIVYLLDARGRALLPLERFRAAAEATGTVLASSYGSRSDEPGDPNLPALQAMWADTRARLSIDDRRVYLAGFSGTARAACTLADLAPGRIAGVIASGAGFPLGRPPRRDTPFLYFAAVGETDFNYSEMRALDRALGGLGLPYRLEVFEGGHDWMPEETAVAALRWMELRANGRAADPALREAQWRRDAWRAAGLEDAGRAFEARRQWAWMARDFDGLRDVAVARARAEALAPAALEDGRQRLAGERREERMIRDARQALGRALARDGGSWSSGRIVSRMQIEPLRKRAGTGTEDGRAALRVLNAVFVQAAFYLPRDARDRGDHERAALFLSVAAAIRPEDAQVWYRLAAAESLAGRPRQAVEALRHSLDAGFTDGGRLAADPDFDRVRRDPGFRGLAARLGR
ncbi:MAG TPA: hypothetical protein VLI67_12155 [Vicinamibacteria bacterium]|nr:hypothetical protein [Vicinamibacteria bacterium]